MRRRRTDRGRSGSKAVALLALGLAALRLAAAPADLRPVPSPRLDGMEAAVREQLESRRRELDALLAAAGTTAPGELAESFGLMGQLYLLYEIAGPARASLANAADLAPEDPRWPYYVGYLEQLAGELEAAAASFRRALERAPASLAAWIRLGQVELAGGRLDAAAEAFRRALELDPQAAAAHAGLAQLAEGEGRFADAVDHYRTALTDQPGASSLRYPLAVACRRLGRMAEARDQLERRGEGTPGFPDPWIDRLGTLAASASPHLVAAGKALADGRLEDALASYQEALEVAPDNPLTHRGYGEALARAGRTEAAVAAYRRALELDPRDAVAHHDLGVLLLSLGRLDEAVRAFETAVELAPGLAAAHANLAAAHGRRGRLDLAVAALDRVLALDPGDRDARRRRAAALVDLGREREALTELRPLVASDPSDLGLRFQLGRALAASGGAEEARRELAAVAGAAGEKPGLAALAHVELARLGDDPVSNLEAAVVLAPELTEARVELGSALLRRDRPEEARAVFEKVLERDPGAAPAHLGRARALLAGAGCPAARPALEESLRRLPREGDLLHLEARLLATCPQAGLRDGARALELALAVFQARPAVDHAETVAMALAELGRYDEAVLFQRQALAEAERQGTAEADLAAARERLAAYRRGEPCRAPWR